MTVDHEEEATECDRGGISGQVALIKRHDSGMLIAIFDILDCSVVEYSLVERELEGPRHLVKTRPGERSCGSVADLGLRTGSQKRSSEQFAKGSAPGKRGLSQVLAQEWKLPR